MLSAMTIFCLPSYREGMPRTIIEAMMMELPVVATNIRGVREEVVEGKTGLLVPTRNSTALAQALSELLSDPIRTVQMGVDGRCRALSLYDESAVVALQIAEIRKRLPKSTGTREFQ
jgi:glycosyltransferase involved in cell wall biosynthesis